ncbi:MAG: 16S rRNA (guanine(527)-N(7))-methyltransferase RsmG [Bacteroidales bacterium]|nr:16S rRNA (guanine(527)-N(7))-methyltransferase RsmG [Bacteroidales bacterium]
MDILLKYFPALSAEQLSKFEILGRLYQEWNVKINIISRKDIDHLYERHILHSLSIAKVIQFKNNTKVLDVGTGGGLPGIPLALMFPGVHFRLIDSIGKKIQVVSAIINELRIKNAETMQLRAEQDKGMYDFVVSRAVTALPDFMKLVKGKIRVNGFNNISNGIIYIKGGDFEEELKVIKKTYKVFNISDFFQEEFFTTKKVVYISG